MNHLAIPQFSSDNKVHVKIAELSQKSHNLVAQGKDIETLQDELNKGVERLWNIKS